jgi:hypothetical protein
VIIGWVYYSLCLWVVRYDDKTRLLLIQTIIQLTSWRAVYEVVILTSPANIDTQSAGAPRTTSQNKTLLYHIAQAAEFWLGIGLFFHDFYQGSANNSFRSVMKCFRNSSTKMLWTYDPFKNERCRWCNTPSPRTRVDFTWQSQTENNRPFLYILTVATAGETSI